MKKDVKNVYGDVQHPDMEPIERCMNQLVEDKVIRCAVPMYKAYAAAVAAKAIEAGVTVEEVMRGRGYAWSMAYNNGGIGNALIHYVKEFSLDGFGGIQPAMLRRYAEMKLRTTYPTSRIVKSESDVTECAIRVLGSMLEPLSLQGYQLYQNVSLDTRIQEPLGANMMVGLDEITYENKGDELGIPAYIQSCIEGTPIYIPDRHENLEESFDCLLLQQPTLELWKQYISYLKPNGVAVMIVEQRFLSGKSNEAMRKEWLSSGKLVGVIEINEQVKPFPYCIVVFRNVSGPKGDGAQGIRLFDAGSIVTPLRHMVRLTVEDQYKLVDGWKDAPTYTVQEIEEKNCALLPRRYGVSLQGKKLRDLVTIQRGTVLKAADLDAMVSEEATKCRYVTLRQVGETFTWDMLPSVQLKEKKKYTLVEEDVVILTKNSPFKVSYLPYRQGMKLLMTGNMYAITAKADVFPEQDTKNVINAEIRKEMANTNLLYVYLLLSSQEIMNQIGKVAESGKVKTISLVQLNEFTIPMPQEEIVARRVERCRRKMRKMEDLRKQLEKEEREFEEILESFV